MCFVHGICAMMAFLPCAAYAGGSDHLFTISSEEGVALWAYDYPSLELRGAASVLFPGESLDKASALARDPISGRLFAAVFPDGEEKAVLVTIDSATAVATEIGPTEERICSIAFDAAGTLYGISAVNESGHEAGELFLLDTADGEATKVADLNGDQDYSHAIGFSAADGKLYHVFGCPMQIEAVDLIGFSTTPITVSGDATCGTIAITPLPDGMSFLSSDCCSLSEIHTNGTVVALNISTEPELVSFAFSPAEAPSPPPCPPGANLYGATEFDMDADALWAIQPATGQAVLVGPMEGYRQFSGLDFDAQGTLWGVCKRASDYADVLVTIDICSAGVTEQAELSGSVFAFFCADGDISFRKSDGQLFLDDCDQLYSVDQVSGIVTPIGAQDGGDGEGLAFGPDDTLYFADQEALHTVDTTDGIKTEIAELDYHVGEGEAFAEVFAMDFLPSTDRLYAVINREMKEEEFKLLAEIDLESGEVEYLARTIGGLTAVAFRRGPVDLSIDKSCSIEAIAAGQEFTYELRVSNAGPEASQHTLATDELPSGLEFVSASDGCSFADGTVTCDLGAIDSGAAVQKSIHVRGVASGLKINTARVSDPVFDLESSNDESTAYAFVLADADGDGVPDDFDGCPNDPQKVEPGPCGCGAADSDNDGVEDCLDGCPDDPAKLAPGACGCGAVEIDLDGNGIPDCIDSNEPAPQPTPDLCANGICGTGLMGFLPLMVFMCSRRRTKSRK